MALFLPWEEKTWWQWDIMQGCPCCLWLGVEGSLMPSWSSGWGDKEPKHGSRRAPLQGHPWDSPLLSQAVGPQLSTPASWLSLSLCAPGIHPDFSSRPRPPFLRARGSYGEGGEGSKGEGAYLGPVVTAHRCGSPARAAAPALASTAQAAFVFPASAPRQPQDSPAPRHHTGWDPR